MDNKNEKKKESIDDILSDLNGLLNKMPSILDGIKMPEIKPVEFKKIDQPAPSGSRPAEASPAVPAPGSAEPSSSKGNSAPFDADKTLVLADFSGLEEGASAPEAQPAQEPGTAPDGGDISSSSQGFDGDKTFVISSLSDLPEGAFAPEQARPEGEGAEAGAKPPAGSVKLAGSPLEPPAAKVKGEGPKPASLSISELTPPEETAGVLEEASLVNPDRVEELSFSSPGETAQGESAGPENTAGLPVAGMNQASDFSADFAVPDIDALLQMSEAKPGDGPAGAPAPLAQAETEPSGDDLVEFERQMSAAVSRELDAGATEQPAAAQDPSPLQAGAAQPEPAAAAEPDFSAFTIEPAPAEAVQDSPAQDVSSQPAPETAAGGFELPSFAAEENAAAAPAPEQAPEPGLQPESGGLEPGSSAPVNPAADASAAEVIQPEPAAEAAPGGLELSAPQIAGDPAAEDTVKFGPASAAAQQLPPQDSVEPVLTVGNPDGPLAGALSAPADGPLSSPQGDGDKTMVVNAPAAGGGDEEKTVVFQAPAAPGITSRAKISDLADLSAKGVPEGIPPERVRTLSFLYSPDDGAMCANLLAEIDAVCLRSQASPMFVKRAAVKMFDPDLNSNFILQTVTDSGAAGLVCVGSIPQEKVYEIENIFTSSGVYFKHFDSESFSHSAVLDMLLELILR
ncbi:MAG TPA: hypothetical protein PKI19_02855 [Elusimicrobiales bacterium]|nr:hypothetical protein [Elusimicrobiales bacterium]